LFFTGGRVRFDVGGNPAIACSTTGNRRLALLDFSQKYE
jgi:hypothetical protein